MIVFVVSADHAYTIQKYLQQWVGPEDDRRIQVVFYEEAPWRWLHLPATYLFADIERLAPEEIATAMDYARSLQACGYRVLNPPARVAPRLELQERLFAAGINPFRYWPRSSFERARFPAFLRRANSHTGSLGALIPDAGQLAEQLRALPESDRTAEDLVLVEFCDTRDEQGRYYKYSAMRVGDTLVPRHVLTSLYWMLKQPDILDAHALETERDYVRRFPHREALMNIFNLGGIDFGRIDYSLHHGAIRVWEINTNPTLMPGRKKLAGSRRELIEETNGMLLQALRVLDRGVMRDSAQHEATWASVRARHNRFAFACRWKRKLFGRQRA